MQKTLNLNIEKDTEQQLHFNTWKENGMKGTSIAATGLGKTRIGIMAIEHVLNMSESNKALVIVPTENLRDNEWVNEFRKWGLSHLLPRVKFMCIQSAYKLSNQKWSIVVVDEVHTTLSHVYRNFYEYNNWETIYCLTATPPENEEYREYLESFSPILMKTDLRKASKLELVSKHRVYNLGVSFTALEALQYQRVDKLYNQAASHLGGVYSAFANATKWRRSRDKEKAKWANIFYTTMQKRKQICYNAINKVKMTNEIIKKFLDRKALVFSESIEFAEKLQEALGTECVTFHSKLSKKERDKALEDFASSNKRVISSVKALNAGLNVPDCSLGICAAGSSKALDNIQRKGRTLRKTDDSKEAIYINLYIKGSQEVKWVRKRTQKDKVKWIESLDEIV